MMHVVRLVLLLIALLDGVSMEGQHAYDPLGMVEPVDMDYRDCAAVLVDGEVLVDSYSPDGKCMIKGRKRSGMLTVATVTMDDQGTPSPAQRLSFQVAIRHRATGTIWMYSSTAISQVAVEEVMRACKEGDQIVILTVDKRYSLPHNVLDLEWGC